MSNDLFKVMKYAHDLSKNKKIIDLVKIMNPLDVAKVFQSKLDIKPKEAAFLFAHFVKESGLTEWAETNPNHFPPPPQANSGNEFPYDPETVLTMKPSSKHKRALETLGDGEASNIAGLNPGVSGNYDSQNLSGDMPTSGGTVANQTHPGWSSSPQGKEYNKDQAPAPKSMPIEVGEGMDDNNMHTSQGSEEGGLSKQVAVTFGGNNTGRTMGRI